MSKSSDLVWFGGLKPVSDIAKHGHAAVHYYASLAVEVPKGASYFTFDSKPVDIDKSGGSVTLVEGEFCSLLVLSNFDCWDYGNRVPNVGYTPFCSRPSETGQGFWAPIISRPL